MDFAYISSVLLVYALLFLAFFFIAVMIYRLIKRKGCFGCSLCSSGGCDNHCGDFRDMNKRGMKPIDLGDEKKISSEEIADSNTDSEE